MSDKMTCPICDSHTSSVLAAVSEGRPCPYCNAAAALITEVNAAWGRHADEKLVERLAELGKRVGGLERDLRRAQSRLSALREEMDRPDEDYDSPW